MQTAKQRVLVVDDDPNILEVCKGVLAGQGYETTCVTTGHQALQEVRRQPFPAAVVDLVLPDVGGLDVVSAIRQADAEAVVVIITGFASLDSAIEAVRRGAYDYLRKPFEAADLTSILARGLEHRQLIKENEQLVTKLNRLNQQLQQNKARLEDKMRIATEEMAVFIDLGRRLSEAHDSPTTAQYILQAAIQLTGADSGAILVVDGSLSRLYPIVSLGITAEELAASPLLVGEGILGEVASSATSKVVNDLLADPQLSEDNLVYVGIRSVLAHPLVTDETVVGIIALFDKPDGPFTDSNLNLIALLAAQVSTVLAAMVIRRSSPQQAPDQFIDLENLLR